MNVLQLFATLTLNKDGYEQNLSEAWNSSDSWAGKIGSVMKTKAVAGFTMVASAIIDVIKKLNQLMQDTMKFADNVGDLSAKFGVSTESISEMQYMASQWSTSTESLTQSMSMLYMRAKSNGDAFRELGISVKDTNGDFKAMDELFYDTLGALSKLDENTKNAYLTDLFGRSAMTNGEVFRQTAESIDEVRKKAHELGLVVSQDTADFAGSINDKMAEVKLQWQSALSSIIAGEDDGEEKLQNFFDNLMVLMEQYVPVFANFSIRLLIQVVVALVRIAPTLVTEIIDAVIDTIFGINWLQVGIDVAKAIAEGMVNVLISTFNMLLGWAGVEIPKVDFNTGENLFTPETLGGEYEVSENIKQDINIKIDANGNTPVGKEGAEATAKALAPYIDKILGGK